MLLLEKRRNSKNSVCFTFLIIRDVTLKKYDKRFNVYRIDFLLLPRDRSITGEGGIWSVERMKNWPERLEQLFVC